MANGQSLRLTGAAATALGIISLHVVLGPLRAGVKGAVLVVCLCLTGFFAAAGLTALTVFAFGLYRLAVSKG